MEKNKILDADLIDIIFDGKNKKYGAYELRKTYNRRLARATITTIVLVLFAFLGSVFSGMADSHEGDMEVIDIHMAKVKKIDPIPPVPPPVTPKTPPPPEPKQIQFNPPVIVDDNVVPDDVKIQEIENDAQISSKTVVSDIKAVIGETPVDVKGSGVLETPKVTNEDTTYVTVQIEAQFPGGPQAWARYMQKNLNPDAPVENGAPAGTYQVRVRFIVSRDGTISEVNAETKNGFGMEDEAVKIIKRGPKWIPALQNGRNVNAYRSQPITFIVGEQ